MADDKDFSDLPLEELTKMQEKLQKYVEKRLEAKKEEALSQIRTLVKEYDLTFDEVMTAIRVHAKRGKAPALYRNPGNPRQTWSGKGEAPNWYTKAKDKNALRIPGS